MLSQKNVMLQQRQVYIKPGLCNAVVYKKTEKISMTTAISPGV